jgi:hypothetical protein
MFLLAKYGTETAIRFAMIKRAVVDLAATGDWTPATGDTKISKDGGNFANATNNPSAVGGTGSIGWTLTLAAAELQAADVNIQIVDSATKAVEDQYLVIYTYGHASAKIPLDLSINQSADNNTILADLHTTDIPDLHTDIADLHTDIAAVKAETVLIVADTNELQTELVNGGRTDLLIDSIITDLAAVHVHAQAIIDDLALVHTHVADCATATALAAAKTVIDDIHATDLPAVKTETASILADTNELQTELVNGGRTDLLIDAIETHVHAIDAKTTNLPASPAAVGSAMLITAGTGAGQLDVTSGVIKANLVQILAATITGTAANLVASFTRFFNVASPALTCASADQTGDAYGKVDTEIGTLQSDVTAIKAKTDMQPSVWYSP